MTPAYQEVEKLLAQIRAIAHSPVVERATDQISVLCSAYMEPGHMKALPAEVTTVHFTPSERQIFNLLLARAGQVVTHDAIKDAVYARDDNEPDSRTVGVHIHRIRKHLTGTPYEGTIENIHGHGYMLKLPPAQKLAA